MRIGGEAWEVRHEFEGRPAVFALLGLIVGLTAILHPVNLVFLGVLFWLRSLVGRCWCALFFVVGLGLSPVQPASLSGRQFVSDIGVVSGAVRRDGTSQRCQVNVSRGTFTLLLTGGPELKFGDHIRVRGVAVPVGVSEELIAKQLGRGTIKAGPGDVTVDGTGGWVSRIAEGWRTSFQEFANRSLGPEPAATVIASVFGVDDVSPAFTQRLRAAGAISLASVSGLQVLLLGGLVAWATVRLPISRATALLLLAGLLMVYVTASGLHAGAIRASLMTLMISAAYLLRRSSDVVSALSLSALLELLWRPAWAYDFGFQMSFVVVGVLALWLPHRSRLMGKSVLVKSGIGAGSIILMFVAAAPLIAYQTGKIGFGSPLTGALIVPAIAPMFVLAISGWLVSFASMSLAAVWMRWLVAPFAGWILACADLASRWAGLGVQVPAFSAYVLVPVYLLFALGGRITSNAFSGERG